MSIQEPIETITGPEEYIALTLDPTKTPALLLNGNGDIFVNGRLAVNDMEVVGGLREFVQGANASRVPTVESVLKEMASLSPDERLKVIRGAIECEDAVGRNVIVRKLTKNLPGYDPSYDPYSE